MSIAPILAPLLVGERRVVFKNITWQGSQQLREIVGEKRAAKMMFDRGILEITIDEVEAEVNLRQWIKSQS